MIRPDVDEIVQVNGIKIHYINWKNSKKPYLLCLHGLTANAYAFQGLVEAGLGKSWNIISIDQRGRGKSSQPAFGYSIREHANDVIALLDHLGIASVSLCGHSFGGLLSTYLAYNFPARIEQVFIIDAAPRMNPRAAEMLMPALSRLDKRSKDFYAYLEMVKASPYMLFWDEAMLPYYQADIDTANDDSVESIIDIAHVMQISTAVGMEPWKVYFNGLIQKSVLFVGTENYTLDEPLLPLHLAQSAANAMHNNTYVEISGNHHTMLYGFGAEQIVGVMNQ